MNFCLIKLLVLYGSYLIPLSRSEEFSNCGYQACPATKPDMLNVHIVSHTHDDVGWLKTFDQYYYGSKKSIDTAAVQYILDSVVEELQLNPDRRFIYVETAFFSRWWDEQDENRRKVVKRLVQSGQLEFISGGWCMNDEAITHYNDIIDQMTLGLRRLKEIFGDCAMPRIAWQIDPFGHSREQASIFAQIGFDGFLFGRLDVHDRGHRLSNKEMEFIWNTSSSLTGSNVQLFSGAIYSTYNAPSGFCFDITCKDEPIIDDKSMPDYNVDQKVRQFINIVTTQAMFFKTNNVIITMGNDFNYQVAGAWFKNLDKLIKYTNKLQANGSKIHLFYSTPTCYLKSLHDAKTTWSVTRDDFLPYASDYSSYWTGFYTSRPALKGYVRKTNNFLQVCKQLNALTAGDSARTTSQNDTEPLTPVLDYVRNRTKQNGTIFERAQAVLQHHDAVTGTSKQLVQNDYVRMLSVGVDQCEKVISDAYNVLGKKKDGKLPKQVFCTKLNVSECHLTEDNQQFVVTVYNPLGRPVTHPVRLPVTGKAYSVRDPKNQLITSQLVVVPNAVRIQPERNSKANMELVFLVDLPPLGYSQFFVKKEDSLDTNSQESKSENVTDEDITISNEFLQVTIDGNSRLLKKIVDLKNNISLPINQNFYWYKPRKTSGAYAFRPSEATPTVLTAKPNATVITGSVVSEVHQVFDSWVSQQIRLYKNSRHLEFEWLVGPIPISNNLGKEVITRFDTPLKSERTFFTDSNGREVLKRIRNYRSWNNSVGEPVAGNYYPITSHIFIKDMKSEGTQLTLLPDRSVGAASINDGSIEMMVHRRLLDDDGFWLFEALNEPGFDYKGLVTRGKTMLLLNHAAKAAIAERDLAQKIFMAPVISFTASQLTPNVWNDIYKSEISNLKNPLPPNVHLLTLETLEPSSVLLRLEHCYQVSDDPSNLSQPITLQLENLFTTFRIKSLEETMLAADRPKSENPTFIWETEDNEVNTVSKYKDMPANERPFNVTLRPMQIRTFIAKVVYFKN